jgi:hypothetical protein
MLLGYISNFGEWRIHAKLHFEDGSESDLLDFLIDSGSASTILSPDDAKMIKIEIDYLSESEFKLWGVGSNTKLPDARKSAFDLPITGIEFIKKMGKSEQHHVEEHNKVLVGGPDWGVGNVIGRDILNRFKLFPKDKTVNLTRIKGVSPGYSIHYYKIRQPERY